MVFWYDQQLQEMQNYAFIKFSASGSYNLQDHLMQNTVAGDAKYFLKSAAIDSLQDLIATIADAKHFEDARYFLKSSCSDAVLVGDAKYFLKSSTIDSLQDLMQVTVCRCKIL